MPPQPSVGNQNFFEQHAGALAITIFKEPLPYDSMSMDTTGNAEEFGLKLWAAFADISDAGVKKLERCQVSDLNTLLLLQPEDLESIRLSLGDLLRFRAGIAKLHAVHDKLPALATTPSFPIKKEPIPTPGSPSSDATVSPEEKLYTQKDVEKLLAGRSAVVVGQDKAPDTRRGAQQSVQQGGGGGFRVVAYCFIIQVNRVFSIWELMKDLLNFDDAPTKVRRFCYLFIF
jgi:hypothetical protein